MECLSLLTSCLLHTVYRLHRVNGDWACQLERANFDPPPTKFFSSVVCPMMDCGRVDDMSPEHVVAGLSPG